MYILKLRWIVVTALLSMVLSVSAFAEVTNSVETKIETKKGDIIFNTQGETYIADYRCKPEMIIKINESKAGLLAQSKSIYMKVDEKFTTDYISVTSSDENVVVKAEKDNENHIIKVYIEEVKTSKPLELRVSVTPYIAREMWKDGAEPILGIRLLTGDEYKDNLFYDLDNEEIVLNNKFLSIQQVYKEIIVYKVKSVALAAGEKNIYIESISHPINNAPYVNDKNVLMVPIREVVNVLDKAEITWDSENEAAVISFKSRKIILKPNSNIMNINGIDVQLNSNVVINDGSVYIGAQELGEALGLGDRYILLDNKNQRIEYILK